MNLENTKVLKKAIDSAELRLDDLIAKAKEADRVGDPAKRIHLNELAVLYNLFLTVGAAVAELQKEYQQGRYP